MEVDVLCVGGGLAGLSLAEQLHRCGRDFVLVEARDRFGGRIKTVHHDSGSFDMGPSWFWPGQPRMASLIDRLGLKRFDQHSEGILTFEDETGVQRGSGFASMQGSYRLEGGLEAMISAMVAQLTQDRLHLGAVVTHLEQTDEGVLATIGDGSSLGTKVIGGKVIGAKSILAKQVVLALPPRVVADRLQFTPPLPDTALRAMRGIATWMAGQAKVVAVYDEPFWRDEGLSGDAMSRLGPMVEIHDASPSEGGPYALFGFIGVPAAERSDETTLLELVQAQLGRLFGAKASKPTKIYWKDWALDPLTATELDQAPLHAHPQYGLPEAMTDLWEGRLHFGSTEVAPLFGGYLEGALEAAERAFRSLDR